MERISLASELSFSRIVYGMWRLSDDVDTSAAHVEAKINACLAQGITSFDQADIYGGYASEEVLGRALKGNSALRDQMQIITKCGILLNGPNFPASKVKYYDTGRTHVVRSVESSLRAMQIEHIDLLLIHRPDPMMDANETGAVLDELIASGKVGAVGVSNFRLHDWTLLQSAMKNPLVANQIELSLTQPDALINGDIAYLQERAVAPMAWSPLGGGSLFGPSHSELLGLLTEIGEEYDVDATAVAIAWILAHPAKILPVLGTNTLSRIARISDACKVSLDRETWYALYVAALGHEVP
jgi:predicted oxidoreductase